MIISEDLQSWLATYFWMKDEQDDMFKYTNPKIKFKDIPPEVEAGLRQWFDDITGMLNGPDNPYAAVYKVDLGSRLGCFPTAMDHKAIHILVDSNSRHALTAAMDIKRLAGM